jgi:hypothetical protein
MQHAFSFLRYNHLNKLTLFFVIILQLYALFFCKLFDITLLTKDNVTFRICLYIENFRNKLQLTILQNIN